MIDAIKCTDTNPATLKSYNSFLAKQHDLVVTSRRTVQSHFVRLLGPDDGIKAATDYDTATGNRLASSGIDVKRCETSGMYARLATDAGEGDILALAAVLTGDAALTECPVAVAETAGPTAMVIPVWPKPVP
ncbi:hypothetical protein, partial [Sphingomonas bacterium]|uniref:hypothetical protein n=1 Tax=Sphingomonas bacterium TaxID=1895847 RepID=UPI001576FD9D